MADLKDDCKYYKVNRWNLTKKYCSNPNEELKKIKEEKGLVKKVGNRIDYGTCIGFEKCPFFEEKVLSEK